MKIGIISNSDVCMPLLYALKDAHFAVMLLLGNTAGPQQVHEGIIAACNKCAIPVVTENSDAAALYNWVHTWRPDIVFVIGYSVRIDTGRLSAVPYGVYNIHFGALPFFMGASPVFWQLKKGVPKLGLTIHVLSEKIDRGAIVWQKEFDNEAHCTYSYVNHLFSYALIEGVDALVKKRQEGIPLPLAEQDHTRAKWYPRPLLQDVLIDWCNMDASEISHLIKACNSWNQGAITIWRGHELKIIDALESNTVAQSAAAPGTITGNGNGIAVCCKGGKLLDVHFFSMNNLLIPARFAGQWGLVKGLQLGA
jgi:methionyl-tRNA formyltransferase